MFDTLLGILSIVAVAGAAVERARARASRDLVLVLAFGAFSIVLAAAAAFHHPTFAAWMQEDAWAEWTTFFFFSSAAYLNLRLALLQWRTRDADSRAGVATRGVLGSLGLAAFAVFVAGEEISWAQRMFAFEPPEFFLENNYQQELNVHNLLKGEELAGISLDSRWLVVMIALGYALVVPLLGLVRWKRQRIIPSVLIPRAFTVPCFFAVAVSEITYPVNLTGEAAELCLGLAFVIDALARSDEVEDDVLGAANRRAAVALLVPLALGCVTPVLVQSLLYGPAEELSAQTSTELRILASDVLAQSRAGTLTFERRSRVHKRLFTAVRDGYLGFAGGSEFLEGGLSPAEEETDGVARRDDRKGYFLDPWNNPYWVLYERHSSALILYSFGANRRRDTNVRGRPFRAGGDDRVVVLSLAPAEAI